MEMFTSLGSCYLLMLLLNTITQNFQSDSYCARTQFCHPRWLASIIVATQINLENAKISL